VAGRAPTLDKLTDRDIAKILGAKPLDFESGTSAGYSNVGLHPAGDDLGEGHGSLARRGARLEHSSIAREWTTACWRRSSGMFTATPTART
jgi:hypothetical protein